MRKPLTLGRSTNSFSNPFCSHVARLEIILMIAQCIQVETIGDAYCVAGGLHKESEMHAVQIALMALKMMELSDDVMTPTGEPIQVRVKYCYSLFNLMMQPPTIHLKRKPFI